MKKHYEKPGMAVENFALSTHIAACTLTANSTDPNICSYNTGGDVIFYSPGACQFDVSIYEQYCYNTPTGGGGIFGS
ncbi:MAG: hypothetical protein ACI3W9_01035 [Eubacteriales bacterium]